jgi:DNA-binding NtrC family response regulator
MHRRPSVANVLIVDDDEDVAWLLEQLLLLDGHTVRMARNGEEGLAALKERTPDLVVLDVEMPVLDGPGLAYRMFVHNCGLENLPIVLLSGVFDLPEVAARVGTPYFRSKPFDPKEMKQLIRCALTERALPRPPV